MRWPPLRRRPLNFSRNGRHSRECRATSSSGERTIISFSAAPYFASPHAIRLALEKSGFRLIAFGSGARSHGETATYYLLACRAATC